MLSNEVDIKNGRIITRDSKTINLDEVDWTTLDPLTEKGQEILKSMKEQYGEKKGEEVFYASKNAGKITGVDSKDSWTNKEKIKAEINILNGHLDNLSMRWDPVLGRYKGTLSEQEAIKKDIDDTNDKIKKLKESLKKV